MTTDLAPHIEAVARRLLGEPSRALSSRTQWRYGSHGSMAVEVAGERRGTWFDFERGVGGGVLDLVGDKLRLSNGAAVAWMESELGIHIDEHRESAPQRQIVATYDYRDEAGELLFQVVRFEPKDFRQRRPDGNGGWNWSVKGVRQVPYRLGELLERPEDAPVYIVEGEKDADRLAKLGLIATCNAGGAGKWRDELSAFLRGASVYILPDNDDVGRAHAQQVAASLHGTTATVRIVELPGLLPKGDVSDWFIAGGTVEQLITICEAAPLWSPTAEDVDPVFAPKPFNDLAKGDIPPRQWLLGTILSRRFVTVLAARGGTGKTTLLIAWAISLATRRDLTGDYVHKRSRVLLLTFEDDLDEVPASAARRADAPQHQRG